MFLQDITNHREFNFTNFWRKNEYQKSFYPIILTKLGYKKDISSSEKESYQRGNVSNNR